MRAVNKRKPCHGRNQSCSGIIEKHLGLTSSTVPANKFQITFIESIRFLYEEIYVRETAKRSWKIRIKKRIAAERIAYELLQVDRLNGMLTAILSQMPSADPNVSSHQLNPVFTVKPLKAGDKMMIILITVDRPSNVRTSAR